MTSPVEATQMIAARDPQPDATRLYLDLMKGCLTRSIFGEKYRPLVKPSLPGVSTSFKFALHKLVAPFLRRRKLELVHTVDFDPVRCEEGGSWPAEAETMLGTKRLDNIEACIRQVIAKGVPGDIIETGVWRGGAMIYALAVLKALGDNSRHVWLADSFQGFPKPDGRYPQDAGDMFWASNHVHIISPQAVRANISRYGLWSERVHLLAGFFHDTLPTVAIEKIAILRLDGDMYGSTMDALTALYPKLQPGGFCIIDDYCITPCRQAVSDFRAKHRIAEDLAPIDQFAVFWQRSQSG